MMGLMPGIWICLVAVMALSALGGLTGCAPWFLQEEEVSFQEATLPELLSRLDQRTAGLMSFKALLDVHVTGSQRFTASLTWMGPQQNQVRGFDRLGRTLFEMRVAGNLIQWSVPGRPPVLLGTVESLAQSASIDAGDLSVAVADLVRVTSALTGPALGGGELPMVERPPGPFYILDGVRMEAGAARLTKRFWIDRQRLRLVRQEFFHPDGTLDLALHFEDFRPTIQGDWPYRLVAQRPGESRVVELVFREVKFNIPIAPEEFRLPEGILP